MSTRVYEVDITKSYLSVFGQMREPLQVNIGLEL